MTVGYKICMKQITHIQVINNLKVLWKVTLKISAPPQYLGVKFTRNGQSVYDRNLITHLIKTKTLNKQEVLILGQHDSTL
jgi:hypothetical protein